MQTALTGLGYAFKYVTPLLFQAMAPEELLTYDVVFYAGPPDINSSNGVDHMLLVNYLTDGGKLYVSDNEMGYYHRTTDPTGFYGTYLQAAYVGDNYGDGVITGMDFMAGLNPDTTADSDPDSFNVGAEGVKIFNTPTNNNAAGVAVTRNGYQAVYTSFDFQRIASANDEMELINRILQYFGIGDMPWLTETPVTGVIPAGEQAVVAVNFNAANVPGAGEYHAELVVTGDNPYDHIIPVTLTVVAADTTSPPAAATGATLAAGRAIPLPHPLPSTTFSLPQDRRSR